MTVPNICKSDLLVAADALEEMGIVNVAELLRDGTLLQEGLYRKFHYMYEHRDYDVPIVITCRMCGGKSKPFSRAMEHDDECLFYGHWSCVTHHSNKDNFQ